MNAAEDISKVCPLYIKWYPFDQKASLHFLLVGGFTLQKMGPTQCFTSLNFLVIFSLMRFNFNNTYIKTMFLRLLDMGRVLTSYSQTPSTYRYWYYFHPNWENRPDLDKNECVVSGPTNH